MKMNEEKKSVIDQPENGIGKAKIVEAVAARFGKQKSDKEKLYEALIDNIKKWMALHEEYITVRQKQLNEVERIVNAMYYCMTSFKPDEVKDAEMRALLTRLQPVFKESNS